MKNTRKYVTPEISKVTSFVPAGHVLQGSIVDTTSITSVGQETTEIDWSESPYNHTWE